MQEPLPLATIHRAVLEFLPGRDDVVLFGAQAVNAYVTEPRMTQDVNLLSTQAEATAEALRVYLSDRFHVAIRVRQIGAGRGFRLYQVRKSGNRHLVDLRQVDTLPPTQEFAGIQVMAPAALIASKIISYHQRQGKPKSGTDWRDLAMLLLTFPDLKTDTGPVQTALQAATSEPAILNLWQEIVVQDIQAEDEEDEF